MTRRILLLDAGNSGVKAARCSMQRRKDGSYKSGRVHLLGRIATAEVDEGWLKHCVAECYGGTEREGLGVRVAFSSVVPRVTEIIRGVFPAEQLWQVTADQDVGWPIDYPDRTRLGSDRLCAAAGARALHDGALVAIDFGTATTFNVVNDKGAFIGGVIAPGYDMMLSYLHEKTAQLPKLEPSFTYKAIGRNTLESMQAGAQYGFSGMVSRILAGICFELIDTYPELMHGTGETTLRWGGAQNPERLAALRKAAEADPSLNADKTLKRKRLGKEWMIPHIPFVVTGGHSKLIVPNLDGLYHVYPNLNLEGLAVMAAYAMGKGKLA